MLANIKQVVDSELEGRRYQGTFRKTLPTFAGVWSDFCSAPGFPAPKYWFDATPGIAQVVTQSDDGGLPHGPNVSPLKKYLRGITVRTDGTALVPTCVHICDYLLYYPSIDEGTTDTQPLDNTLTLPRYADGAGVQMLAVSVAARSGGQEFFVTYTNQDGVSGRTSQIVRQNAVTTTGNIVTSAQATVNSANPFIGLQSGDTGVRSVESVTMLGTDVGLFSLLLVKPLAQFSMQEAGIFVEKDFLMHELSTPQIYDDAFLGLLVLSTGSAANATIYGYIKCIYN